MKPCVSAAGGRQHRGGCHRHASRQRRRGGRQGAAGGHEIVDEHHHLTPRGTREPARGGEHAGRGRGSLRGGQAGGVGPDRGRHEHRHGPRGDAGEPQTGDGCPAQSLHVLPAPRPRDGRLGEDRHEPDTRRRCRPGVQASHLEDGLRQQRREWTGELTPPVLLVRDQCPAQRPVIRAGGDDRRQAGWTGVRPGRPGTARRGTTSDAERTAVPAAAGAAGGQEEVGEET